MDGYFWWEAKEARQPGIDRTEGGCVDYVSDGPPGGHLGESVWSRWIK